MGRKGRKKQAMVIHIKDGRTRPSISLAGHGHGAAGSGAAPRARAAAWPAPGAHHPPRRAWPHHRHQPLGPLLGRRRLRQQHGRHPRRPARRAGARPRAQRRRALPAPARPPSPARCCCRRRGGGARGPGEGGRGGAPAAAGPGVLGGRDEAGGRRGGVRHLPGGVRGRGRRARDAGVRPRLPRALHRALARGGTPLVLPHVPRAAGRHRRDRSHHGPGRGRRVAVILRLPSMACLNLLW
ncbi:hypothetical protein PVAP13_1NG004573 [Panicum virgatum]|uniref:Uncharacterized protein n=1 Tax=Panicum virgatum TaxID=38727 RepID=A0A8T0WGM1_PANVG|nr:hypothetical protein PVAP13_1NG004573 [Panicum virgatum]